MCPQRFEKQICLVKAVEILVHVIFESRTYKVSGEVKIRWSYTLGNDTNSLEINL